MTGASISGVAITLIGALSGAYARFVRTRAAALEDTPRSQVGQVKRDGYYEVQGKVVCDAPMASPYDGNPCVYYKYKVEERYEEPYRDSEGKQTMKSRTRTLQDETRHVRFTIEDRTGRIAVRSDEATIQGHSTSRRSEGESRGFGDLVRNMAGMGPGRRVLSTTETVEWLRVGDTLFAIGGVTVVGGTPEMGPDRAGGRPFLLSIHSEDDILASDQMHFQAACVGAAVGLVAGPLLALFG